MAKIQTPAQELSDFKPLLTVRNQNVRHAAKCAVAKAAQKQILILRLSERLIIRIRTEPLCLPAPGRMREWKTTKGLANNLLVIRSDRHDSNQIVAGKHHRTR